MGDSFLEHLEGEAGDITVLLSVKQLDLIALHSSRQDTEVFLCTDIGLGRYLYNNTC